MPSFDGAGPWGQGPLAGGGRGYCGGTAPPPWGGRSGGRGWRNQYYATGLTGWQRQARGFAGPAGTTPPAAEPTATAADEAELLARLDASIAQIIERLDHLEAAVKT